MQHVVLYMGLYIETHTQSSDITKMSSAAHYALYWLKDNAKLGFSVGTPREDESIQIKWLPNSVSNAWPISWNRGRRNFKGLIKHIIFGSTTNQGLVSLPGVGRVYVSSQQSRRHSLGRCILCSGHGYLCPLLKLSSGLNLGIYRDEFSEEYTIKSLEIAIYKISMEVTDACFVLAGA